ncbi:MAG: Flp family type IVb pilin [Desulfobulbaceae bacterium]|nr:Flp family type IVb pilin [Desulfobulbaceae bacterium]
MRMIINFLKEEEGVTAIEYALIAALVAVAGILGWTALGTSINTQADFVADKIDASALPPAS